MSYCEHCGKIKKKEIKKVGDPLANFYTDAHNLTQEIPKAVNFVIQESRKTGALASYSDLVRALNVAKNDLNNALTLIDKYDLV